MDWSIIIVGFLSLCGTLGGSYLGVRQSNRLVNFRLEELEKKVDKHNNLVERMAKVEMDVKTAFLLLDNLREGKGRV